MTARDNRCAVAQPAAESRNVLFGHSLDSAPSSVKDWLRRELKAGEELLFSVVDLDGTKTVSHSIRRERGRYHVWGMACEELGAFATTRAAMAAGFAASREALQHEL